MDNDHPIKKVVLTLLGQRGAVAVSAEGCDPYLRVYDFGRPAETADALGELLLMVPDTLAQARATWQEQPRHEAHQATAAATPAAVRPTPKPGRGRRAGPIEQAAQGQQSLLDLLPPQPAQQEEQP